MITKIFLEKDSKFNLSTKVDVILSNQLYWQRIFDIPIDSYKDVIEVLPSFFDDFFDVKGYKFYAVKLEKHKYLCFAYIENHIVEVIKSSGLEFKNIKNIYFAQNEITANLDENKFYKINNSIYVNQNNILMCLPNNLSKNKDVKKLYLNDIKLSKHKIYINQSSKYIDIKTAYILSFFLIAFSIINFYKTIIIKNDANDFENKILILKETNNLPISKIQTKSILNEYKSVKSNYINFRNSLDYILNYKKVSSAILSDIQYKENELILRCQNKNKTKIEKYIKKKYKILSSDIYNGILEIRIKI